MKIVGVVSWLVSLVVSLLGGRDRLLDVLLLMMGFDLLSAVLVGLYHERYDLHEAYRLVLRKVGILIAVAVAVALDRVVPLTDDAQLVRAGVIGSFIGLVEGPSVLRNLRLLGLPLPAQLERALFRTVPADERRAEAEPAPPLGK